MTVTKRVRLPDPSERATCAARATPGFKAAKTLAVPGSTPLCYLHATSPTAEPEGAQVARQVARGVLPGKPSNHAGFGPQVAQVAQVARLGADRASHDPSGAAHTTYAAYDGDTFHQPMDETRARPTREPLPQAGHGAVCRCCDGPFANRTAAHHACLEEAEAERLLTAAERAVASPEALADPAEGWWA